MHVGQIYYVNVTAQASRDPLTFNTSLSEGKRFTFPFASIWYINR